MSRPLTFEDRVSMVEIDENDHGQRIDNFLLRVCKGVPKSHVYRILRSGEVRVNKGRIDASYRLAEGDTVRIPPIRVAAAAGSIGRGSLEGSAAASLPGIAPSQPLPIVFEDAHLLVIDKPAGVAVHGGSGIAYGVIEQLRRARPAERFLELVHRLDRDTSGLLMLAKKRSALTALHAQLRDNQTDKRYLACVVGEWSDARRVVKAPLHKFVNGEGERRVMVRDDGLPSHTIFARLEAFSGYTLVEAQLKTGRTHQIRVHLQHVGTPIAGDEKYGEFSLNRTLARSGASPSLRRMFLHAAKLRIQHPASGEPLQLAAPLPAECVAFIDQLRKLG